MKLQSVQLQNFRCFEDITIHFHERLTVLVGGNGSGKSAVLDAITPEIATIAGLLIKAGHYHLAGSFSFKDIHNYEENLPNFKFSFSNFEKYSNYPISLEKDINDKLTLSADSYKSYKTIKKSIDNKLEDKIICYYRSLKNTTPIYINNIYIYTSSQNLSYETTLKWFSDKEAEEAKHAKKIKNMEYNNPELQAVRDAVRTILGDYEAPYTDKVPVDMFITKKGNPDTIYSVSQLSDGYRTMLAFVIDLARMMAIANAEEYNKQKKSVLESPAIVLIDEVDLHLHPSWQQRVLPDLMRTFPNTQFIVTTHSPQVISSIAKEHIRVLEDGKVHGADYVTEGVDSARILQEVFEVNPLPQNISWAKKLNECQDFIYNGKWDSAQVTKLLQELETHYGNDYPPLYEMKLHRENLQWEKEHEND